MVKSKKLMILESIASGAMDVASVMVALLGIRYGSSFWEMKRKLEESLEKDIYSEKDKRSLRQLISKLKRDGLLESLEGNLKITVKGKERLVKDTINLLPDYKYKRSPDKGLKIIAFDIPEKERRKRKWVRDALVVLGFKMLQKSVWYGKGDIPEGFIRDLRNINILEYVDILAVTKTGSIKQV